jgi:basic membrane lipoprotein Med (substrate-binding protein (PBP1-ABC) superfamily)
LVATAGIVSLALAAAACGSSDSGGKGESGGDDGSNSDALKVAMVMPGVINDLSFNQMAYQGAKQLDDEGVISFAYTESVPEDAASLNRVVSQYIDDGYKLILANSFGYKDAIFALAKENPDVDFAWAGGIGEMADNVADYEQPVYIPAYLAGILAAGFTESKLLGGVGAFEIPSCVAQMKGFLLGAQTVDPSITESITYSGSWDDVKKNQEAAQALSNSGADVFVPCGEGPALGAIAVARADDKFAIGNVGDMSSLAPDNVFASEILNFYPLWKAMVEDVSSGSFNPGKYYPVSFELGSLDVAVNDKLTSQVPPEIMEKFETALEKVKSGELEVPYVEK